jgi:CheY-like chemotaxis protein
MEHMRAVHQHRILLVYDYLDLREAVACLLETHGCRVITASSGPEALAILKGGYRPCVMFLDYVMPEMDGREVCPRMTPRSSPHLGLPTEGPAFMPARPPPQPDEFDFA